MEGTLWASYPKKNYMIDTFLFLRLLKPILSLKYLFFVNHGRHDVIVKSGCFSAPERGDFSKNSDILPLNVKLSISIYLSSGGQWFYDR